MTLWHTSHQVITSYCQLHILPLRSSWTCVASLLLGIFSNLTFSSSTGAKPFSLCCWCIGPVLHKELFFTIWDGCGSSIVSSLNGFNTSKAGSGVSDRRWDPLMRPRRPRPRPRPLPLPLPLPRPTPGGLPNWRLLLSACWRPVLSGPRFHGGIHHGFVWTGGPRRWAEGPDSCLSSTGRDAGLWEMWNTLSAKINDKNTLGEYPKNSPFE